MDFFANHLKIGERAARNAEEGPDEGEGKCFVQMRLKEGPLHRFENPMSYDGLFFCVEIALQSIVQIF